MSLGAAVPGTVVPSGAEVSPGGPQGQGGQSGNTGPIGPNGDSNPVGAIIAWPAVAAPANHMICDGSAVSRTLYPALFSAIGTQYGSGDGSTTFNLPDLRSRMIVGYGQGGGLSNRALAAIGGEENHVLSTAELAIHAHACHTVSHNHGDYGHGHSDSGHSHGIGISGQAIAAPGGSGAYWGGGNTQTGPSGAGILTGYASLAAAGDIGTTSDNAGSGSGHNNMPPFICLVWVIKVAMGGGPSAQAPIANQTVAGLMNILSGAATDYVGGDNACHPATNLFANARLNSYNALGNPNFEIDARTGGIGTTGAGWIQDRWRLGATGSALAAKQMAGQVIIPGTSFPISQNFLRVTVNIQNASPAPTDYAQVFQFVEGPRIRQLFGGSSYVTLLVRSSVAGLVLGVAIGDSAGAWTCTQPGTITNAGQWTTVPLPAFPIFTSSGTFPTTQGNLGLTLGIGLFAGSTYTSTANGVWINKNLVTAYNQSNFAAAPVGSTFDLAFVQHEPVAFTQFMDIDFDTNLARCGRYFECCPVLPPNASAWVQIGELLPSSTTVRSSIVFRTPKAKPPTMAIYDANGSGGKVYVDGSGSMFLSVYPPTTIYAAKDLTLTSAGPGGCYAVVGQWTADTGW